MNATVTLFDQHVVPGTMLFSWYDVKIAISVDIVHNVRHIRWMRYVIPQKKWILTDIEKYTNRRIPWNLGSDGFFLQPPAGRGQIGVL
jgi:hypothetical protein